MSPTLTPVPSGGVTSRRFSPRSRPYGLIYPVGRFLISLIFLSAGFGKFADLNGTVEAIAGQGLPRSMPLAAIAASVELAAGFLLLFGRKATWLAAWVLFLYLIPVTLLFHTNFSDPGQTVNFLKNLAIMGGLLELGIVSRERDLELTLRSEIQEQKQEGRPGDQAPSEPRKSA